MRRLALLLAAWAGAAPAQGLLSEADLRACLGDLVDFSTVAIRETPRDGSTFRGRRTPPLGEDTEWRRDDRVLTIENSRRHVPGFIPDDPTIYRDLHFEHLLARPIVGLSLHGEAGPLDRPIGVGASLLLFPGGLAPYTPYRQRLAVHLPDTGHGLTGTIELRLLPLDAIDAQGRSFIRDFGQALCAPELAPADEDARPESPRGRR